MASVFEPYLGYWKGAVVILAPLLFLPLPLIVHTPAARCGYVILVMASYWITESVHLSATALIPIFAFPLLGVMSTKEVCLAYMKDTNMLFLGGLAMAAAIEHSGIHEKIAIFTLSKIGSSTERLLFGFMLTQMFLSMWISNTAATAMMIPIIDALLSEVYKVEQSLEAKKDRSASSLVKNSRKNSEDTTLSLTDCEDDIRESKSNGAVSEAGSGSQRPSNQDNLLRDILYLGVAYAANIGGTGSLTGTNPNLVLVGFLQLWYENADTGINYATWILFNVPGMLLATLLGFIWLRIVLLYYNNWERNEVPERKEAIQQILKRRIESQGKVSFHEGMVAVLFGLAILLWVFRKPEVITGWGALVEDAVGVKVSAATPAILIVFLMFVAPTKPFWGKHIHEGPSPGCLTWEVFHHKISWGVLILIGGGFAMAEGGKNSGMSSWIGEQFGLLSGLPKEGLLIILCVLTALLTEIMSNTAASSLLIPVLNDMALSMKVNPIYFLLPVTLCSSYAFMLPVATPPNALVFQAAKTMPISRMMNVGIVMNLVCVLVNYTMINTFGSVFFDFNTFPHWANSTLT